MRCPLCQVGHLDAVGRCANCNTEPGGKALSPQRQAAPIIRGEAPRIEAPPPARTRRCPSCSELLEEPVPPRCPHCQRLTKLTVSASKSKICGHCGTPNPTERVQCTLCYHSV